MLTWGQAPPSGMALGKNVPPLVQGHPRLPGGASGNSSRVGGGCTGSPSLNLERGRSVELALPSFHGVEDERKHLDRPMVGVIPYLPHTSGQGSGGRGAPSGPCGGHGRVYRNVN